MKQYPINRNLKRDIRTAVAWGVPDNESYGYSAIKFTELLTRARTRIEQLESILTANNIPFPHTDWK